MFRRAPADRLSRRGRGQTGEAAKGRRLWCGGHRDRRPSFFFRGLPARGEARGKAPLWGRGWTRERMAVRCPSGHGPPGRGDGRGGSGMAALFLSDTACLGGETAGMGADGGAALPDRPARVGERMAVRPSGHGPPGRGDGRDGSGWRRCPSGHGPPGRGDGRDGSGWRRCLPDTACLGGEDGRDGSGRAFWREGEGDFSLGTAAEWTANAVKASSFI